MILHARWQSRHERGPVLVWLHGFLGSGAEWLRVQECFRDWPQLSVDLPGHGGSYAQRVRDFAALSQRLSETLRFHNVQRYWLTGYSLGGRVALYHAAHRPPGLVGLAVEGAHFGLSSEHERAQRLASDRRWAERFRQQPLDETLAQWYRQPVFADLSETARRATLRLRQNNHREGLAAMLLATSLARQPNLLPAIRRLRLPFLYLCGEQDSKFQQLARQAALPFATIPHAGHNAHRANPAAFARQLAQALHPLKENR